MSAPRHYTRWPVAEGYAARQSVFAGDPVEVHASSRTSKVSVEVARLGQQRHVVWQQDVEIGDHPTPDTAWSDGCGWPVAFTVPTQSDWRPGVYEIRFTTGDQPDDVSQAFVVIRHSGPDRPAAVLVLATNTWQAYNQWGGKCFYSGATELSFRRPIERGYIDRVVDPDGYDGRVATTTDVDDFEHARLPKYLDDHDYPLWIASGSWFNWERRLGEWAESIDVELDYAVDADLDADPELLSGRGVLLTAGHNEYWSGGMRDHADAFVERGGNWIILSGNTCFWQIRYTENQHSLIAHKTSARFSDPVAGTDQQHTLTSMWSDPWIGRPENTTIGLSFTRGGYHRVGEATPRGPGGYIVEQPDHWVFEGTGLCYGDIVGASATAVGYEVDGCVMQVVDGKLRPTGEDSTPLSLEILATAPARLLSITPEHCEAPISLWASADPPGDLEGVAIVLFGDASKANTDRVARGHAVMGIFQRGAGTVFNAGSANWCYGLGSDPQIEQITRNVLTRFLP